MSVLPRKSYRVTWYADFEASSVSEAAALALEQLRDIDNPEAFAPVFDVTGPDGTAQVDTGL